MQVTDAPSAAMAQKTLWVTSPNGDQWTVSVVDTTTVREIMQQSDEDGVVRDREATLIHGVTVLEPDMTVSEAGLEDGAEISLLWSDPFVEMASWTGEEIGEDLYVQIPPETTSIEDRAFSGCKVLVKVMIPNSVVSIGSHAFARCTSLTHVEIPDSVTSIRGGAFAECTSLRQVEIPNSVTSIGPEAFMGCISLTRVEFPNSVTHVAYWAFRGCSSLTRVGISNSMATIHAGAFAECTSLNEVEIPDSVSSIGSGVFEGCSPSLLAGSKPEV